jgi:hypothetical protein
MRPNDTPPGELCDGCDCAIDANEDAISRDGRWWCMETCRRDSGIGEAEQLGLEVAR